ncbi:MAG: hypothetical protein ACU84Q_03165 [Gammaproteobacteria bacterium]
MVAALWESQMFGWSQGSLIINDWRKREVIQLGSGIVYRSMHPDVETERVDRAVKQRAYLMSQWITIGSQEIIARQRHGRVRKVIIGPIVFKGENCALGGQAN